MELSCSNEASKIAGPDSRCDLHTVSAIQELTLECCNLLLQHFLFPFFHHELATAVFKLCDSSKLVSFGLPSLLVQLQTSTALMQVYSIGAHTRIRHSILDVAH